MIVTASSTLTIIDTPHIATTCRYPEYHLGDASLPD